MGELFERRWEERDRDRDRDRDRQRVRETEKKEGSLILAWP